MANNWVPYLLNTPRVTNIPPPAPAYYPDTSIRSAPSPSDDYWDTVQLHAYGPVDKQPDPSVIETGENEPRESVVDERALRWRKRKNRFCCTFGLVFLVGVLTLALVACLYMKPKIDRADYCYGHPQDSVKCSTEELKWAHYCTRYYKVDTEKCVAKGVLRSTESLTSRSATKITSPNCMFWTCMWPRRRW